jgi:hypothetical protein
MRLPSEIQFHQDIRLLIYRSLGLIGEKALNSVIKVIEDLEAATQEPFNRFPDTLGTDEVEIFNLMQDPYERADITSNTFWDWQINHVGSMYGVMDDIFKFAATYKDYPPRSSPPSFNPANIMEETLRTIKAKQKIEAAFPMLRQETPKPKE